MLLPVARSGQALPKGRPSGLLREPGIAGERAHVCSTGLSSASRSTLAGVQTVPLSEQGRQVMLLDGDPLLARILQQPGLAEERLDINSPLEAVSSRSPGAHRDDRSCQRALAPRDEILPVLSHPIGPCFNPPVGILVAQTVQVRCSGSLHATR